MKKIGEDIQLLSLLVHGADQNYPSTMIDVRMKLKYEVVKIRRCNNSPCSDREMLTYDINEAYYYCELLLTNTIKYINKNFNCHCEFEVRAI